MVQQEVPSPIDFTNLQEARHWARTAMDRPFRMDMFNEFAKSFQANRFENALELGSGPGFLAEYLCQRIPDIALTLLDFSEAMHELARERLAQFRQPIEFLRKDFKDPDWGCGMRRYSCVVSIQAVHELRHKSFARALHEQVKDVLVDGGVYLVCDHFFGPDGMQNDQLYMTPDEQVSCMQSAGFDTEVLLRKGSLQLIQAIPKSLGNTHTSTV
jgi:SAM-dependent methyltransferase